MIIGVTGKIGSGKHTVAKTLTEQGFFLINADKLAHGLYVRGSEIWHKLVDTFGKKIVGKNYEIDRVKLGKIVFADLDKMNELNLIIHSELKKTIKSKIADAVRQNKENIVVVAALGEELDFKNLVEKIVLIKAPIEKRIDWLKESRGLKEKDILQRNDSQKEIKNYDLIIENDEDLAELEKKVLKLIT